MTGAAEQENQLLEAENNRLLQEIGRLRHQVEVHQKGTGGLNEFQLCLPSPQGFLHLVKGTREALLQVANAHRDLEACQAALRVTGSELARQKVRGDQFAQALLQEQGRLEAAENREAMLRRRIRRFEARRVVLFMNLEQASGAGL